MTNRLAKVWGPPASTADTMTAMYIAAGQTSTMCPAPKRWKRSACSAVIDAQINMAAKTAQVTQVSSRPDARNAITTFNTVGARTSAAPWNPTANATSGGHASSGSYWIGCSTLRLLNSQPFVRSLSGRPACV